MAALRFLRRWRCQRGAELVEFALVLPLLLLLVMGVIDFGFAFQQYEVVTNAAREGARVAVLGYSSSDVQARVSQYLTLSGLTATPTTTPLAPTAVSIGGSCMTVTGVTVAYPHQWTYVGGVFSLLGGSFGTTTLTATSRMRYEGAAVACP